MGIRREEVRAIAARTQSAYTLGPPLRTPDYKNLGMDLALEELRTCPQPGGNRRYHTDLHVTRRRHRLRRRRLHRLQQHPRAILASPP